MSVNHKLLSVDLFSHARVKEHANYDTNKALSGKPLLFISVIHRLVSPNVKVNIYAFESINERRLAR